jgi:hypothetical protein
MVSVALLGDSVFDNKSYVGGEPDVAAHLRQLAPDTWKVGLLAVDGSLVQNVRGQLSGIADDTSHLVISAGGNNAIQNADVLQMRIQSSAEILTVLSDRAEAFEHEYRKMVSSVLAKRIPMAVSTIYFPNFADATVQKVAVAALSIFNDAIIRQAAVNGLPILDLRIICSEAGDYANEIEPSGEGGRKIASAIVRMLEEHDFFRSRSQIYF